MAKQSRARRRILFLIAAAVVVALCAWLVSGLGRWLVVADSLEHAQAIVVLGGGLPFRAMEAAELYRQGWAPQVWITRTKPSPEDITLLQLGIVPIKQETYERQVLERLGVPGGSVLLLDRGVRNTLEEVELIAGESKRTGGGCVILVTSKPHTRRVRTIWRKAVGDSPRAIVRYAADEPYESIRWWGNTRDALAVAREVLGLMNAWAGFPVQPAEN
jgi:uncharacterized SAM-binding protein YcdF (DUF218 family)